MSNPSVPPSYPSALRALIAKVDDYMNRCQFYGAADALRDSWARLKAALVPPAEASAGDSLRALIDRLENYYDFECTGGPLRDCVEWQQLKAALVPPAEASAGDSLRGLIARWRQEAYESHPMCSIPYPVILREHADELEALVPPVEATPQRQIESCHERVVRLEAQLEATMAALKTSTVVVIEASQLGDASSVVCLRDDRTDVPERRC